jgi:K+/H+ antiporter YhaU regulatory subunit KhtT
MAGSAQTALDIAVNLQQKMLNSVTLEKESLLQMCAAIQELAENALGVTPTSTSVGDGLAAADVATNTAVSTPNS